MIYQTPKKDTSGITKVYVIYYNVTTRGKLKKKKKNIEEAQMNLEIITSS